MKILVKFPTRERPKKFLEVLQGYINLSKDKDNVHYMITVDDNDQSMHGVFIKGELAKIKNIVVHSGQSANKIHAVNRDMQKAMPDWDLLVLASDDMVCQVEGWDSILRNEMAEHFPKLDGVLFHWDGDPNTKKHNNGQGLNTMCILGRAYYEMFGYIYHPAYKSLWCDNEFTDVADILQKQYRSDQVLFKHKHFSNDVSIQPDALMKKTQSYFKEDEATYNERKKINFGL